MRRYPVLSIIFWITAMGLLFIGISLMAFSTLYFRTWIPFVAFLWIGWFAQDYIRHGRKKKKYAGVSFERQKVALDEYVAEVKLREED